MKAREGKKLRAKQFSNRHTVNDSLMLQPVHYTQNTYTVLPPYCTIKLRSPTVQYILIWGVTNGKLFSSLAQTYLIFTDVAFVPTQYTVSEPTSISF